MSQPFLSFPQRWSVLLSLGVAWAIAVVADPGQAGEAGAEQGLQVFLDGEVLPSDEGLALDRLHVWLDKLHWTPGWEHGDTSRVAFAQLRDLSQAVEQAPWLAIGLGQALLLYFWWTGSGSELDVDALRLSALMHWVSVKHAGCDNPELPRAVFQALQCGWRWRHVFMIPAELGITLARHHTNLQLAAALLRDAHESFAAARRLPYFQRPEWQSLYAVNTNSDFFPGPVNRPVWPRGSVAFADFLEAHATTFLTDLDFMLQGGHFDDIYWGGEVSMTQFAPLHEGWSMVSLVKNRQVMSKACAFANASCEALRTRPELMSCGVGDAGAAFARLLPGMALRPHFWNAPRLAVHLGLRTPPGATMHVGGEEVVWEDGKATVFDDTYVHSVLHEGSEARFVLVAWFCHPCDTKLASVPPERLDPLCQWT